MQHTITIIARLNNGDRIVRSSFRGVSRMPQSEINAHRSCGVTIYCSPRLLG